MMIISLQENECMIYKYKGDSCKNLIHSSNLMELVYSDRNYYLLIQITKMF